MADSTSIDHPSPAGPAIVLSSVSQAFGEHVVIRKLDLVVRTGELVALLGRTGAGKSTALNLVMGNLRPTVGNVRVLGLDPMEKASDLRGKMAVSFQTDCLLPWRTAIANVELGLEFIGTPKAERRTIAANWLERVKLGAEHFEKYPRQLSGGMRQRVSLARALAVDPNVVLLDESFSQLDQRTSRDLRKDFVMLAKKFSKTTMLITHRIEDALDMADRIIVLGAPAEVKLELPIADENRENFEWRRNATQRIESALHCLHNKGRVS